MSENSGIPLDCELAHEAAKGSLPAMESLVLRHEARLYRFLLSRMQNPMVAEDLTQETFIIACRKIHRYNPRFAFTTWLFTIGNRLAASAWRRYRPTVETIPEIKDSSPNPADSAEFNEARDNLWSKARMLLSDSQYAALWLHYGEDLAIKEIARTLRKTVPGVKVLLHRGRNKLAGHLEKSSGNFRRSTMEPALSIS